MRFSLTGLLFILLTVTVYGQELVNQKGITVFSEAAKLETGKKNDKWKVKITISNTTGSDLYFTATTGASAIAFDAPYFRLDIPNAKGLLTLTVKYYRGKMVDGVLTPNNQAIYKIPAGIFEETVETAVAIGDVPVVKGTIIVEPKSYEAITGTVSSAPAPAQTATPVSAPVTDPAEVMVFTRASLPSGQKLQLNEAIEMPAIKENRLTLEANGNLSLSNDGGKTSVWTSDTGGKKVSYAEMLTDGNFVLKTATGEVVWSTDTAGNPGAMLVLGQSGNAVIFSKEFKPLWQIP